MTLQLEMFEIEDFSLLKEEMKKTKDTSENVRKGIFARFNALEKEITKKYLDQQEKIESLELKIKEITCQN